MIIISFVHLVLICTAMVIIFLVAHLYVFATRNIHNQQRPLQRPLQRPQQRQQQRVQESVRRQAKCPFCRALHPSNDTTVITKNQDVDGNDIIMPICRICMDEDLLSHSIRCCSQELCLVCAGHENFALPPP
jgi:hypothetical protein